MTAWQGRWGDELAPSEPLQRMRAAHRLFTAAILLDPGSDAAASNLAIVGGRGACADLADGGEPDWNAPCEQIPGIRPQDPPCLAFRLIVSVRHPLNSMVQQCTTPECCTTRRETPHTRAASGRL